MSERKKIAASGRQLAKPSKGAEAAAVNATGQQMVDSLDIPAAMNPTFLSLTSPDPSASLTLPHFGRIKPKKGSSFLVLSTGKTGDALFPAEPGVDFAPAGPAGDVTTLRFQVTVPPNVNRLSFDYTFLSAESPDFIGLQFNDTFTARVTDASGVDREVASASVNASGFHPASDTSVGAGPFLLYVDNTDGVDTQFGPQIGSTHDAGTTGYKRVDVPIVGGGTVIVEFDIRDLGDGILDSAVLIDNVALSSVEVVDPQGELINNFLGQVITPPNPLLATGGKPAGAVAADGVTQVLLRSAVPDAGQVTFRLAADGKDGHLSAVANTPAWSDSVTVTPQTINGQSYALALYRSPPNFNRGGGEDEAAAVRNVPLSMTDEQSGSTHDFTIGVVRPPVVVIPDIWSNCDAWRDLNSLMNTDLPGPAAGSSFANPFRISCVDYHGVGTKSSLGEAKITAVPNAINEAIGKLRREGVAVTQADVIGHGTGGLLARQYIDARSFVRFDNFNAGAIRRLITVNTPHLGARMADEIVALRNFAKQRQKPDGTTVWDGIKETLNVGRIYVDDADGDVAIDEMTTCDPAASPTCGSIINQIGKNAPPPPSTFYHALVSTGGRAITRSQSQLLLDNSRIVGEFKSLYSVAEFNHPRSYNLLPVPKRQSLVFKHSTAQGDFPSIIFCPDAQATDADEHDTFATVIEQRGNLGDGFVTQFPVDVGATTSGHFRVHNDRAHTLRLAELLNAPVDGGLFATSMSPPGTVPRRAACASPPPGLQGRAAQALAQGSIAISSPAPGTTVSPGEEVPVVIDTGGEEQPEAVMIVSPGDSVLIEAPPFAASIRVPATAIGALPITAIAFYETSDPAFAQTIEVNVSVPAALTSIETTNGDIVLQRPGSTRQLTAIGTYSDGVRRDITQAALGTQYVVSNLDPFAPTVLASTGGLITAVNPGIATVAIRNGNVITSITATVGEPACGDGVLDPGEECDDGNVASNDGCSSACVIDNHPPDCSGAGASPGFLLASSNPNFWPIEIEGVSDSDGDSVTVTATHIRQDEPVSDLWCPGGTCADATLEPLTVRAERDTWAEEDPQPDGRVYHIAFQATDARGATCTGLVKVCVQRTHDVVSCIDGGPLYDSLTTTP